MRREIEAALDSQRNIVPLMFAGFDFGTPAIGSQLTGKLAALKSYNGIEIPKARFFSSEMERLRDKFLNVPVDAVLHPASASAQQVAKEQKDKATTVLWDKSLTTRRIGAVVIALLTVVAAAVWTYWAEDWLHDFARWHLDQSGPLSKAGAPRIDSYDPRAQIYYELLIGALIFALGGVAALLVLVRRPNFRHRAWIYVGFMLIVLPASLYNFSQGDIVLARTASSLHSHPSAAEHYQALTVPPARPVSHRKTNS
jgi:hypothetical protein